MLKKNFAHSPPIGKIVFPGFLAFGWLVSTHHLPWPYFNSDFIVAAVLLILWGTILFAHKGPLEIPRIAYLCLAVSVIPLLQYAMGLIEISGQAFLGFFYILGFFLSITLGWVGERIRPRYVADIVFGAFLIGSIASVGLQLQQWLGLEVSPLINMGGDSGRPYANLGQPNQLGTLLLIGVAAVTWFCHRAMLGLTTASIVVVFIALGLALTKSLAAFVGLSLILLMVMNLFVFRDESDIKYFYKTLFIAYTLILIIIQLQSYINMGLQDKSFNIQNIDLSAQSSAHQRLLIWMSCILAVLNSPIFGYGWNQTLAGYLAVVMDSQQNNGLIYYSHNFVLDLFLWCGIPLGLLLLIGAVKVLIGRLKVSISTDAKIALCGVLPFLSHSFFEQPYAYGYLLMPVGVLIGMFFLETSQNYHPNFTDKIVLYLSTGLASLALFIFALDYLRISEQYERLLYKEMRVVTIPPVVPHTYVLNQWEKYFSLSLADENLLTSEEKLKDLEKLTKVIATPAIYWKTAKAQASAGQIQASRDTVDLMCKIFPENVCLAVKPKLENQ